jgi:hypothetical protein
MAIRWKVVDKERRSCIVSQDSKYSLTYKKGHVVKADDITIGILVFKRKKDAEAFFGFTSIAEEGEKIIKVRTFERGKRPKRLCSVDEMDAIYEKILHKKGTSEDLFTFRTVPKGTLAYPRVEVLT